MRASDFITEALSPIVYHYTSPHAARKILQAGEFELSSATGSVEQQYAPKGYPYFLSTTRTRRGGYHDTGYQVNKGVLFVLDGSWYNSRYPAGPVDYWENRDPAKVSHRKHEAEDRIYSRNPTIPTKGVTSVHILVTDDADDNTRAEARRSLILAKRQNIPVYYYNDQSAWLNFDTSKTAPVGGLTGQASDRSYISGRRGYLLPWLELIQAREQSQLSKKADGIRYGLNYTYDKQSAAQGLANELSNARKPGSGPDRENAIKIIKYMQQNRLNDISELVDHLAEKWKKS